MQIQDQARIMIAVSGVLALSACADRPTTTVTTSLPANSVVMLDPMSDDAMIPALAEGLSRGSVTVYRLDDPNTSTALLRPPAPAVPSMAASAVPAGPRVVLRPPAENDRGSDPRVTVFGVGGGMGVPPVVPVTPEPLANPAPPLQPPLAAQPPLQSPFTKDGALRPDTSSAPVTLTNAPAAPPTGPAPRAEPPAGTPGLWAVPSPGFSENTIPFGGTGSRAVTVTDLMRPIEDAPPDTKKPPARPPKGMTY